MTLILVTPPAAEPLSLDEAKLHLKVDETADNALITALIKSAREVAETVTWRALITQTWKLVLHGFPCTILLPKPPLQQVTAIEYVDDAGAVQTLAVSEYQVLLGELGAIVPAYGKTWPTTRAEPDAVRVTYAAGYGVAGSSLPEPIRSAMLLLIEQWYRHRGPINVGSTVNKLPNTVDVLLWPQRDPRWG